MQSVHVLGEIAPGGEWTVHPTKAISGRVYEVRYTAGEKEWRWVVDMETWDVSKSTME